MAYQDCYGLRELQSEFPNDAFCLEYLFNTSHSRQCSCGGIFKPLFKMVEGKFKGRRKFQCSRCRYQIAPMNGTIFEKTSTPLTLWFHAIFIFSNAKSGISAKEMQRQLNVTYKCAYRIMKLIREVLKQDNDKLSGNVEMDEGFVGGKGDGGKYNENYKAVMADKSKVIAAIERDGKMKAKKVADLSAMSIWQFLEDYVQKDTQLYTDGSNRYDTAVTAQGMNRKKVNHSKKQYVKGAAHVNSVEWFWSHIKKSIKGTFKSVSKDQLQSYLDAFVWHYNNRGKDRTRFENLLKTLIPVLR